jgi:hypothetical protein
MPQRKKNSKCEEIHITKDNLVSIKQDVKTGVALITIKDAEDLLSETFDKKDDGLSTGKRSKREVKALIALITRTERVKKPNAQDLGNGSFEDNEDELEVAQDDAIFLATFGLEFYQMVHDPSSDLGITVKSGSKTELEFQIHGLGQKCLSALETIQRYVIRRSRDKHFKLWKTTIKKTTHGYYLDMWKKKATHTKAHPPMKKHDGDDMEMVGDLLRNHIRSYAEFSRFINVRNGVDVAREDGTGITNWRLITKQPIKKGDLILEEQAFLGFGNLNIHHDLDEAFALAYSFAMYIVDCQWDVHFGAEMGSLFPRNQSQWDEHDRQYQDVLKTHAEGSPPHLIHRITSCYAKILKNSFVINFIENMEPPIPVVALFHTASAMNHSCDPNSDYFVTNHRDLGLRIKITALKDIAAGEEITCCYNDNFAKPMYPAARKLLIQKMMHFTCNCTLCKDVDIENHEIVVNRTEDPRVSRMKGEMAKDKSLQLSKALKDLVAGMSMSCEETLLETSLQNATPHVIVQ